MSNETIQHWANPRTMLIALNLADISVLPLHAISQARQSGKKLLLVNVIRPSSPLANCDPGAQSRIKNAQVAAAWRALHAIAKTLDTQDVSCEPIVLEGDPIDLICLLVRARSVDRVLVASQDRRGAVELAEESLAEALISSVDVPVCVIGPRVVASPFLDPTGGRVFVAMSLQDTGNLHLRFADALAQSRNSDLVLVHILGSSGLSAARMEEARKMARHKLDRLIAGICLASRHVEVSIREGGAVGPLLDEGICPSADCIVMGTSSESPTSNQPGNRIAHQVIAKAPCPVFTLRRPPAPKKDGSEAEFVVHGFV